MSILQRERLDSAISGLLEQLEQIPDELELQLTVPSGADTDEGLADEARPPTSSISPDPL